MSKHNRHNINEPAQRTANTNPTPRDDRANSAPVRGVCYWRGKDGWIMAEVTLPESVAREYATKVYEPDLLGMVVARAADRIERAAQ